jgi:hypothetical protein
MHGIPAEIHPVELAGGHPFAHGDDGDIEALGEVRDVRQSAGMELASDGASGPHYSGSLRPHAMAAAGSPRASCTSAFSKSCSTVASSS